MEPLYIDPQRYLGRPLSKAGRTERELACYDLLDKLEILYDRVDHAHADTIADCEAVERVLGEKVCKNLFLCNRQQTAFYLLLLSGDKVFKTKELSKQLDVARLSFAGPEQMLEFLNLTPGSVSVLGLMNDRDCRVRLVIDQSVAAAKRVGCHPCINTSTLALSLDDLLQKFLPHVAHTPTFVDLPEAQAEI